MDTEYYWITLIGGMNYASLKAYVDEGRPTGGFLRAVLENNLSESFRRADRKNVNIVQDIVRFVYYELPHVSWGSPENVSTWIELGGMKGLGR